MPQNRPASWSCLGTDQDPLCLIGIKRDVAATGKQSHQLEVHREHLILTENNDIGSGQLCSFCANLAFTQ